MPHTSEPAVQTSTHPRSKDPRIKGLRRRPRWRQRLVDAERGWVGGVRSDSSFFVYFFLGSVVLAAALVLGLGWIEWTISVLALSLVLTTELLHQTLKMLAQVFGEHNPELCRRALATSLAARMTAVAGSAVAVAIIFWQHLQQILQ